MKSKQTRMCEACGEGTLSAVEAWDDVEYKGHHGRIRSHHSVCSFCGAELTSASEVLLNRREWVRYRKSIDNIPLGNEIAEMRKSKGLTQAQAGRLFGGGPIAFSKYENDDIVPDEPMANLLYMFIRHPELIQWLQERKELVGTAKLTERLIIQQLPNWKVAGWRDIDLWKCTNVFEENRSTEADSSAFSVGYPSLGEQTWQASVIQKPH